MVGKNQSTGTRPHRSPSAVGIIGYGAIGQVVADAITGGRAGNTTLAAIMCRDREKDRGPGKRAVENPNVVFTDNPELFFETPADIIIEAAGQDALRKFGKRVLEDGSDLLVTSIGAFTDSDFFQELIRSAEYNDARLLLASGALPGVDWMSAAGLSEITTVEITQTKPVNSWRNTPAEAMLNLDEVTDAICFFQGTARQAASRFPKSSNITAMLALSTAGMDRTEVKLVADPTRKQMCTLIRFEGVAGKLLIEWHGVPSILNPSTSADVPLAVIKAIRNLTSTVCYGV
jgi:aspartate dehydrogenase